MATWNVQDLSLSHATSGTVRNILGFAGAAGADLLIQLFGLGSIALILCVAVWGWRLLTHRLLDREIMRAVMWLLTAAFAAGFASCMPRSGSWPLPTGLGGVVGDAFLRLPAALFGPLGGPLAPRVWRDLRNDNLRLLRFASGHGSREREQPRRADVPSAVRKRSKSLDDDGDESERRFFAVTLGWLGHQVLSIKAWLTRLLPRCSACSRDARVGLRQRAASVSNRASMDAALRWRRRRMTTTKRNTRKKTRKRKKSRRRVRKRPNPPRAVARSSSCRPCRCWLRRAHRTVTRRARTSSSRTPNRSKACCRISACAARSSMRGRGRGHAL